MPQCSIPARGEWPQWADLDHVAAPTWRADNGRSLRRHRIERKGGRAAVRASAMAWTEPLRLGLSRDAGPEGDAPGPAADIAQMLRKAA